MTVEPMTDEQEAILLGDVDNDADATAMGNALLRLLDSDEREHVATATMTLIAGLVEMAHRYCNLLQEVTERAKASLDNGEFATDEVGTVQQLEDYYKAITSTVKDIDSWMQRMGWLVMFRRWADNGMGAVA